MSEYDRLKKQKDDLEAKQKAQMLAEMAPKEILIRSVHDEENDPDCDSDHYQYELLFDGTLIKSFGDEYHNDSSSRCAGFLAGVEFALGVKLPAPKRESVTRKF